MCNTAMDVTSRLKKKNYIALILVSEEINNDTGPDKIQKQITENKMNENK